MKDGCRGWGFTGCVSVNGGSMECVVVLQGVEIHQGVQMWWRGWAHVGCVNVVHRVGWKTLGMRMW